MLNKINLREAAIDLRYLLSRGYNRKSIIDLVGDKWNLNRDERHILYRAIFSLEEIKVRQWNEVQIEDIEGKTVAIDTYNILITIESFLKGLVIIQADDQYLRDISRVFNKYKQSPYTLQSIQMILTELQPHHPKEILFYLDKNISRSGELAALIKKELNNFKLEGDAQTVPSSDKSVIMNGEVVVSSDRVILERARNHLNLISLLIEDKKLSDENILKIE
ncbi:MAG: DUF434 domain-containing protein [Candidatus Helarchaeota archaeon]|nr:DUF434 domain-containing protein [Candidatus Helarchaeota archaeon]